MAFPEPLKFGSDWAETEAVALLLHGHGQAPDDMRALTLAIDCPNVRYILPEAEGGTWFPKGITESFEENATAVDRSVAYLRALIDDLRRRGLALERIVPGGVSHGACVVAEFLVRHPRSYGGALILSGGLIDVAAIGRRPGAGLLGVPVYVSGSETDETIPIERTRGAIKTLQAGGALIRSHVFPDRASMILADEILEARKLLNDVKTVAGKDN